MGADFLLVVRWWGTLFLVGAAAYPITRRLFRDWWDQGHLFSKAVGLAIVPWIVYVLGTIRLLPFSPASQYLALGALFLAGLALHLNPKAKKPRFGNVTAMAAGELFFFGALLLWAWVKGHEPSIRGLEKFMDYGFMKSILESAYFPPADMWYTPLPVNYYYFGHLVTAFLTKLSGVDLAYSFNIMLATLFAFTLTMSFSIGYQIARKTKIVAGALTAFLVTLAGNMQTIYAFTRGYVGENVQPFWQLAWRMGEFLQRLPEGMERYWYANATRFIPFTIHEFPSYSFVVSDVHGHVLSLPFVLLAIALLFTRKINVMFYGFLCGILLMTNALDGPIYLALLAAVLGVTMIQRGNVSHERWKQFGKTMAISVVSAAAASAPFLWHFKSFVSGLAVNCPPAFLADTKIGPLLFEGVEKCQHSPLWMLWLLWGFFVFTGAFVVVRKATKPAESLLKVLFVFSILLIIFPEFFYFKDIYPAHFRSNTMFKLGYDAFIMLSIVSAYAILRAWEQRRKLFLLLVLPQLLLVSIYPMFSVRSYFNGLRYYDGLYGLNWIAREYPDDLDSMEWLETQPRGVLVEAVGESYTDASRFSAFTGMPVIMGWPVHEWLWRGSYDVVSPRQEEVRKMYESENLAEVNEILKKYDVRYVIVGTTERTTYANLNEETFAALGELAFESGAVRVYQIY